MTTRTAFPNFARPAWVADWQSVDRDGGHQIDWAAVTEVYRETAGGIVTLNGAKTAGDTSLTVLALPVALPDNLLLDFGGGKFARVNGAVAAGVTSVTVDAIPTNLVGTETAIVAGSGKKTIPGGTIMEIVSGAKMKPAAITGTTAHGLLAATAVEGNPVSAQSGHGLIIGGVVYENLLPEATGGPPKVLNSTLKTSLETNSKGFVYRQYGDDRAT